MNPEALKVVIMVKKLSLVPPKEFKAQVKAMNTVRMLIVLLKKSCVRV